MDTKHTIWWSKPMKIYSALFLLAFVSFMAGLNLLKVSAVLIFFLCVAAFMGAVVLSQVKK